MRKQHLLHAVLLVIVIAFSAISCKKEQTTLDTTQGEATLARIMDFKQKVEAYQMNPAMKSGATISLTEAIWNIENLFNLTYAKPEDAYSETSEFVFSLYLPIDAQGNVLETDLFCLYEQVKAMARTNYANTDFVNKGFLFMTVELGEQIDGFARIDFRGKAGERSAHYHDSLMYMGPFTPEDYWEYKRGWGKCDGTNQDSGADDQIEIHLQEYISSLLAVSEAGRRPVYLNRFNIVFDGKCAPSYAFYRTNVDATCIDFNNMNYYYGREKRYIVDILPNDPSTQIYGYVPVEVFIHGERLTNLTDETQYITHVNEVTYTQRIIASINVVGETMDLLCN